MPGGELLIVSASRLKCIYISLGSLLGLSEYRAQVDYNKDSNIIFQPYDEAM